MLSAAAIALAWGALPADAAQPLPTIQTYQAAETSIYKIQAVRLWWKVIGATRVDVWDGFRNTTYANLGNENYIEVWPERTADYILYAYNADNQYVTSKITIQVVRIDPQVELFEASPPTIDRVQPVRLSWRVKYAKRVDVHDGFKDALYPNLGSENLIEVYPERSADYTLRAYGEHGQLVTRKLTVTFQWKDPIIDYFHSSVDFISSPQNIRLYWRVREAVRVDVNVNDGYDNRTFNSVGLDSFVEVFVQRNTTCVLYAYNGAGKVVTRQIYLSTTANTARIEQFVTSSPTIHQGQAVALSWRVQGAVRIDIYNEAGLQFGSLQSEGTVQAYPNRTTHYTLYAYGQNNQAATATIRIDVLP